MDGCIFFAHPKQPFLDLLRDPCLYSWKVLCVHGILLRLSLLYLRELFQWLLYACDMVVINFSRLVFQAKLAPSVCWPSRWYWTRHVEPEYNSFPRLCLPQISSILLPLSIASPCSTPDGQVPEQKKAKFRPTGARCANPPVL